MPNKEKVNWLYFGLIFLFLSLLSFVHFYYSTYVGWSLFLYAFSLVIEVFAETFLFYFIASALIKQKSRLLYYGFISFTFLILLMQIIHFMMLRLMDSNLLLFFKTFFSAGFDNFLFLLRACNINIYFIILASLLIVLLPFAGPGLYVLTKRLIKKRIFSLPIRNILLIEIICFVSLLGLEKAGRKFLSSQEWRYFQKTMPIGSSFQKKDLLTIQLHKPLKKPTSPVKIVRKATKKPLTTTYKPNIYLFILEALRKDFLTFTVAPNIHNFSKDCLAFDETFSNANYSHPSWFAVLHASFPFHWKYFQTHFQCGSPILQILKKMGYEISVISSAELPYYQMDMVLFGKDHYLANFYENFFGKTPDQRDQLCFNLLKEKNIKKEGQLFIVFLDSTHSEYSWPQDYKAPFTPVCDSINYIELSYNHSSLDKVKNRYANAINYLDHLFGSFICSLKEKNIYDDSIIILTGDHGEEFFEENSFFHSSHLNRYQLSVPIMCKFKTPPKHQRKIASHIDIFPSVLDYLTKRNDIVSLFDGCSFFDLQRPLFTLAVSQNANLAPDHIAIIDGKTIMHFKFSYKKDLYDATHLHMISQQSMKDEPKELSNSEITSLTEKNLKYLY